MRKRWTRREIDIINSNMTMDEKAKITGRTIRAITDKQGEMKRGYCAEPLDEPEAIVRNPYKKLTMEQKIRRINDLADKLQVKIAR